MAKKTEWQFLEWYRGVVIEYRPGMQRRGFASIYRNGYADDHHVGSFVHHSLANARRHIDKLNKDLGAGCHITEQEYKQYIS